MDSSSGSTGSGSENPGPFEPSTSGWQPAWVLGPRRPRSRWQRWGRNLVLFLLTLVSVFLVGGVATRELPDGAAALTLDVSSGLLQLVALMSILVAHEMGHYLTCRHYGIDASLPYFVPMPLPPFGTLGAFIRIRAPIPTRRALFDVGVAGPLAGFAVCLPWLWLGIAQAQIVRHSPVPGEIAFGEPLVFRWLSHFLNGPVPDGFVLTIGPVGLAAWFGLFVTALNLMPMGQLDGGHATYALLHTTAHRISIVASWVCVALVYFGPNWLIWAIVIRVLGRRHPPTLDDASGIGRGRIWIGILCLLIFAVCFVPDPVQFSWRDAFGAVRSWLAS